MDEVFFWVFKRTLFLWLFPYIFWFLGKKVYASVSAWVMEPSRER